MREISDDQWSRARKMACDGVPFKDIRNAVGISKRQLKLRSDSEKWATPQRIKRAVHKETRAHKETMIEDVRGEVAARYAKERGKHRDAMIDRVNTIMDNTNFDQISVDSVKDLKMLDEVQRRNLGMDLEDEGNAKRINPALYPVQ